MSDTVIKVENISKQYRLGQVGTGTLSHDLNRIWHKMRGNEDPYLKIGEVNDRTQAGSSEYVWSLRDVSFDVKRGEVLGIIGKNGAGKSTLLKILSRVTQPTTGNIKIKGRIASLLEVGTGFHPELTGRENIFLNGAILGMTKAEIKSKFAEIVDFSGVERYIDTPVKRFSSGMYVRLAFAVAAHLDPEILVIDEVLAVGDADFQQKCIDKMEKVARDGRTVIVVSHNMTLVRKLCKKAVLLHHGQLIKDGLIEDVVASYINANYKETYEAEKSSDTSKPICFRKIEIIHNNENGTADISYNSDIQITLCYDVNKSVSNAIVWFDVRSVDDTIIFSSCDYDLNFEQLKIREIGTYIANVVIPGRFLNKGIYRVVFGSFSSATNTAFDRNEEIIFSIVDDNVYPSSEGYTRPGLLRPMLKWKIEKKKSYVS